jgi:hypothetical protein
MDLPMNIKTEFGVKVPQSSMDLPVFDQNEYIPYLSDLVSSAKAQVPFYSRFYRNQTGVIGSLDDFSRLPMVNEGMLLRERLEDMVTDMSDIHEVCYPSGKLVSECCMPRVQSQNDQEDQYLILEYILEECLRIDVKKDKPSIAMIADENNSYSAGAFCKMVILLLNCPFFGLIVRGHSSSELIDELTLCNPEILITTIPLTNETIPQSVHTIVEIGEQPLLRSLGNSVCHSHILFHPLLGLIGSSVDEPGRYYYNPDHYYIENTNDTMLVYTSFMQHLMPVVRLRSRHWGKVIKPGLLEINYLGTH